MKRTFSQDGYYHIYNRGTLKQDLFLDNRDYMRFLFLLIGSQGDYSFSKVSRIIGQCRTLATSHIEKILLENKPYIIKNRSVEILNFCIMPNHFHITLHELREGGVSNYMQKLSTGYSKYFNKKYDKSGHVLQGAYKCKHILSDEQNFYLSAYIHSNPKELSIWKNNFDNYPWSSYQDYIYKNRWNDLLSTSLILEAHSSTNNYKDFVHSSGAKDLLDDFLN